jgi:hypothetical protein
VQDNHPSSAVTTISSSTTLPYPVKLYDIAIFSVSWRVFGGRKTKILIPKSRQLNSYLANI